MNSKKIGLFILSVAVGIVIFFALTGCASPHKREYKQPRQCDDMDRMIDTAIGMTSVFSKENTSAAVALNLVTLTYTDCKAAREKAKSDDRYNDCKFMIYKTKVLKKKQDYAKYADFAECRENKLDK